MLGPPGVESVSTDPSAERAPTVPETGAGYRRIRWFLDLVCRMYFREVEVVGAEHVPPDRGGIIVAWHPNGLLDPGLILTQFPRQVVFGARHGLFRWPLLGLVLRSVGTVPIYRATDLPKESEEARRIANQKSLDALAAEVARGSFSALFPEGVSHDKPHPVEVKTGAARLYYRARGMQPAGAPAPVILPVGLHYDKKTLFRSRALVWFHAPLVLPPALDVRPAPGEAEEPARERSRALTAEIERVLHDVVHATEDWETHRLFHRGRKLVRAERALRAGAEPGPPGIEERELGFARIWKGYLQLREKDPARVAALVERGARYDAEIRALGLNDHELDRPPPVPSPRLAALLLLQALCLVLFLPPILLFGYVSNGPTFLLIVALRYLAARYRKDIATIKALVGAVAFPLTWVAAGVVSALAHRRLHQAFPTVPDHPALAGTFAFVLAALGFAVIVNYQRVVVETWHAVRVRLTHRRRRETIERLKAERARFSDELLSIAAGLDLPGVVAPDGTIRRE